MSIFFNNSSINDWDFGTSNIVKVYHNNAVCYYKVSGESPTPSYKWLATYTGGTISSAECDSTSAITENEITKTNLESVVIGDCVTSIDGMAFYKCSSLTSCTIGSGVTSIGTWAFYKCTSLTNITLNATTPPSLGSMTFNNTNNCPIYVPSQSLEAYKTAWSTYASRIQAIP